MGGFRVAFDAEQRRLTFHFTQLWQRSAIRRQPLVSAAIAPQLSELQQQSPGILERQQPLVSAALPLVLRAEPQLFGAFAFVLCAIALLLGSKSQLLRTFVLGTFALVLRSQPQLLCTKS